MFTFRLWFRPRVASLLLLCGSSSAAEAGWQADAGTARRIWQPMSARQRSGLVALATPGRRGHDPGAHYPLPALSPRSHHATRRYHGNQRKISRSSSRTPTRRLHYRRCAPGCRSVIMLYVCEMLPLLPGGDTTNNLKRSFSRQLYIYTLCRVNT